MESEPVNAQKLALSVCCAGGSKVSVKLDCTQEVSTDAEEQKEQFDRDALTLWEFLSVNLPAGTMDRLAWYFAQDVKNNSLRLVEPKERMDD